VNLRTEGEGQVSGGFDSTKRSAAGGSTSIMSPVAAWAKARGRRNTTALAESSVRVIGEKMQ
jgi:hypothetical protein